MEVPQTHIPEKTLPNAEKKKILAPVKPQINNHKYNT
jgi:hypothetical protein